MKLKHLLKQPGCCHCFKGHLFQVRHKQDWGQGFICVLLQAAVLLRSDAGSDVVKPTLSFVIQNCQTSYSVWCPMYGRCYKNVVATALAIQ